MDISKKEEWEKTGIDIESALDRFMGNESLLNRFLKKFLDDPNYGKLQKAIEEGDAEAAVAASHTLKGLCGNLSMKDLFDLFTRQVALFRSGKFEEAAALMTEIAPAYERITEAIRRI